MALTARASNFRYAWGKQTAETTALAAPTYEASLAQGSIKPNSVEEFYDAIDTEELPSGAYISRADGVGNPQIFGDNELFGAIWFRHLGGVSKSGTTPNFVNTITRATAPVFTTDYLFRPGVGAGAGVWERQVDVFCQKVEFACAKGDAPTFQLTTIAKDPRANAAVPTPANDRRIKAASTQMLTYIGGTFKIDFDTQTPAQIRNLENVAVSSEWVGAEWVQTDSLIPTYLDKGELRVGFSCDGLVTDYNWMHGTFFGVDGTPGADAVASAVDLIGSVDLQFERQGVAVDANRNGRVVLGYISLRATPMEPDASGKALRVHLEGSLVAPAAGEPITVTSKSGTDGTLW